ncbi:MAG: YfcE family phosphodiesterase [Oscillospiraceae bacterium]|nr:YfcE family phosphodiesterase [Oscillospiraceae bacterium]
MRIVAMSDSHGDSFALERVFEMTAESGNIFVHLGDGERELDMMRMKYPNLDIRHVAGNCDYRSMSPNMDIIFAGDVKILCTHGHLHGVKYGTETLRSVARDNGCKAVLFGHTHCRYQSLEDGIYMLNPGSCACPRDGNRPSFGWIDITPAGIITNIVEL